MQTARGSLCAAVFQGWGLRDIIWALAVAFLVSQYMNMSMERDIAVIGAKPKGDAVHSHSPTALRGEETGTSSNKASNKDDKAGESGALSLECSDAQMNETVTALHHYVRNMHEKASREAKRTTFTMGSWRNQACAQRKAPYVSPTDLDHVLVLIMGGSFHRARSVAVRATWARHFKHTVLMGDFEDKEIGMITLPELYNKTSYDAAQQRSLKSLLYGVAHLPEGM